MKGLYRTSYPSRVYPRNVKLIHQNQYNAMYQLTKRRRKHIIIVTYDIIEKEPTSAFDKKNLSKPK